jgi:hypothetical protein
MAKSATRETADLAGSLSDGIGKVLQVVQTQISTAASTSSSSYVDTLLTASITPVSTNSKILVLVDISCSGNNSYTYHKLVRDGVNINVDGNGMSKYQYDPTNYSYYGMRAVQINFLDSPAKNTEVVYKVQWKASSTSYINRSAYTAGRGGTSSITLMEIGG